MHYKMTDGSTACERPGPWTRAKAMVDCPECLAKVTYWGAALVRAKAAWAKRVAEVGR